MTKRLKKILKYGLSVLVAVLLLWVSFKGVDWKMFWQGMQSCNWTFVIISMALGLVSFYYRGLRWRQLVLSLDRSTTRTTCFNAVTISYIINMLLPRAGEFIACGYVHRHSKLGPNGKKLASYDKVLGTGLVDRIWDLLTVTLFLVVLLFFFQDIFGSFFTEKLFAPITERLSVSVSGFVIAVLLAVIAIIAACVWACIHFRTKSKFCRKVYELGSNILVSMRNCFLAKNWWRTMLYSIFVWVCYWLAAYTILLALQGLDPASFSSDMADGINSLMSLNLVDALFLMIVGSLSTVVPVPGGFGAYHYLVSLSLSAVYGIPTEIGLIFATLSHESQVLIQILCGSGSYIYEAMVKVK